MPAALPADACDPYPGAGAGRGGGVLPALPPLRVPAVHFLGTGQAPASESGTGSVATFTMRSWAHGAEGGPGHANAGIGPRARGRVRC